MLILLFTEGDLEVYYMQACSKVAQNTGSDNLVNSVLLLLWCCIDEECHGNKRQCPAKALPSPTPHAAGINAFFNEHEMSISFLP